MMKKIFLALVLLLPISIIAQQQPTLIKVSARAVHIDASPQYKATVSLSAPYSNTPSEMVDLEELKKQYKEALEANTISWNDLKEDFNDFGYETTGHGKDGILYVYRTESVEKMKKFLETESLGVLHLNSASIITIDDDEAKKLSQNALAKARKRASAIAKAMGKELGELQEIQDLNNRWGEEVENVLYYDRPSTEYIHMVHVIYTVK